MLSRMWISMSVLIFLLVNSALALSAQRISQEMTVNLFPMSFQEADAIKKHTSPNQAKPLAKDGTSSTTSSSGSPATTTSSSSCISYDPSTITITVSCPSARLSDLYNELHDNSILAKQSPAGTWFLNANIVIAKGGTLHIDSTDTKWLKISSKVTRGAGVTSKFGPAYWIDVHGGLKIDSVKITSWDPTTNYYAITNGSRTGSGVFILGAPRPSIVVENNATGTTDVTNSEIAYLGFEQGKHKGGSGLSYYYGGDGSVIRNNDIHHVYFGLYTFGVGHMIVENNIIRNSGHYGLDPHTGTHDMIIRNNTVYDNNGSGIICSLNCYNILIENNKVHDNAENGIDFSRNMYNSIARNNVVYNEAQGIFVSQSHNNEASNNTLTDNEDAIYVNSGSTNNKLHDNTIMNSKSHAILIKNGSSANTFYSNKISSTNAQGLIISQDSSSKNNLFLNNQIISNGRASTTTPAEPSTAAAAGDTIKHPHNKKTSTK
jgi:poly(beta-D-mannuronate) C5 epimerase